MMDVKRFDAIAVDGKNLVIYDRNCFKCDTVLGVWKRRWELLGLWCVGIFAGMRLAEMFFVRCEQQLSYCRRLQDVADANVEVAEGDPGHQCWFSGKPYTNMYLMLGCDYRRRASELKSRHMMGVRNPIIVEWLYLEMFAVPPKDRHLHYVLLLAFWQNVEAPCMLCLMSPPTSVCCLSDFGDKALRFGHLLFETAMTELTIMLFVCFVQGGEYGVSDLSMPARL